MTTDANGIKNANNTTNDNRMKITLHLMEFFIVICPGPKNSGDVKVAEGVQDAMLAAKAMITAKAGRFISPSDSRAMPILKNNTIATTFDMKFVRINALTISVMTTANGAMPAISG